MSWCDEHQQAAPCGPCDTREIEQLEARVKELEESSHKQLDESEIIRRVTRATRAADEAFQKIGGSSRHWVRECFLPAIEEEGLVITERALRGKEGGDESQT